MKIEASLMNAAVEPPVAAPLPLSGLLIGSRQTVLPEDTAPAREQFEIFRALSFASVLEPAFLATIQSVCRQSPFISNPTEPGHREVEHPQRAGAALKLVLNRPTLLRWLENVTGCAPLREIVGMMAQTLPRPGDGLEWHDDISHDQNEHRILALTINLSDAPFEGGEFELRRKSGEMILRNKYTEAGSMMLFRVSRKLEHRVLPILSGGPRRVFAGWALGKEPA